MGAANGNGAAAATRKPPQQRQRQQQEERSGRGPVASAVLLALTLLTPVAILALGLACGDPSSSPWASRASLALGQAPHARACRALAAAAPDVAPAAATLAAWVGAGAARARSGLGGLAGRGRALAATKKNKKAPTCQLSGTVDAECCHCTYSDVQRLNERHVAPHVQALVTTAFFRYFKVNIACDCPLWPDDSMCALKACSVCQCGEDEVPAPWLAAERGGGGGGGGGGNGSSAPSNKNASGCSGAADPGCSTADCALEASGRVDARLDDRVASRLRHVRGWRGLDNPWIYNATEERRAQRLRARQFGAFGGGGGVDAAGGEDQRGDDEEDEEQYQYINLVANPERYTGYKGEHAHRIWAAVYGQSCFASPGGPSLLKAELARCTEKRVFYRLISGMHASISAHLVGDWLLDEARGEWGPNMPEFRRRFVDDPEAGERVANLYFAYLFVLRAVTKAAPLLADPAQYDTGLPDEDARTRELVRGLLGRDGGAGVLLREACPLPFDEGRLWRGEEGPALRRQLQSAFQNITRVMDCVGCEKCKLWGKLQTLGVATALKILFTEEDCEGNPGAPLRLAVAGAGAGAGAGAAAAAADKAAAGVLAAPGSSAPSSSSGDEEDYADGYDDEDEGGSVVAAGGGGEGGGGGGGGASAAPKAPRGPLRPMTLERNEVIALVNLLGRFSNALRLYHELSRRVAEADGTADDAGTVLA